MFNPTQCLTRLIVLLLSVWGIVSGKIDLSLEKSASRKIFGLTENELGKIAIIQERTREKSFCTYETALGVTVDGNGNVSEYLDQTGEIAAHYEYDPFGNTTVSTGLPSTSFNHRFSSKYYDQESNLYYYGYRLYDPELGRWINRDPLGERGGTNLYAFVLNDPINYWDYLGLECDGVFDRETGTLTLTDRETGETITIEAESCLLYTSPSPRDA